MSLSSARKDWPGKFVFSFAVGAPKRGDASIEYTGVLEVADAQEMSAVAAAFMDWIEKRQPALKKIKPPPGMVGIEKSEEDE